MKLKHKVALITGASSGVGNAIANTFASNGYDVVLAARRIEILKQLSDKFSEQYKVKALPIKADLAIEADIENLFRKTSDEFGRLDVLVNVAGNFQDLSFVNSSVSEFIESYKISRQLMLDSVIYACKFGLDMIIKNKGVIINISSDAG